MRFLRSSCLRYFVACHFAGTVSHCAHLSISRIRPQQSDAPRRFPPSHAQRRRSAPPPHRFSLRGKLHSVRGRRRPLHRSPRRPLATAVRLRERPTPRHASAHKFSISHPRKANSPPRKRSQIFHFATRSSTPGPSAITSAPATIVPSAITSSRHLENSIRL